jgi:hypothetical protein|tara:strand:- start:262 stop:507 length:246 start_codon:yes stop_codon:yes gene_type:complete
MSYNKVLIRIKNLRSKISTTMPKKPYESDTTTFIKSLFKKNPELREKQLKARSIWWDREQDLTERSDLEKSNVTKKPYEYY